jgi:uncharacterized RDD family membrane protein YckC
MKCKRCLAPVPDEADRCPNCGQDLSSLRQLLKDFYEDPPPFHEPDWVSAPGPQIPVEKKEGPEPSDQPRVIYNSPPEEWTRKLALHEPYEEDEAGQERRLPLQEPEILPGGFWLRSLAMAVDSLFLFLFLATFLVVGFIALEIGWSFLRDLTFLQKARLVLPIFFPWGAIFVVAYFTFCHGTWGQTLGKMIFGLQVLRSDGEPLGMDRSLLRTILYLLSAIPLGLGFLWIALSPEKRAWHDGLAGTVVIRK